MNIFNDNKGFFQGGKSFGGKGFIEPLLQMLRERKIQQGGQSTGPQAFNGVVGDTGQGIQNNMNGYFDPVTGQWISYSQIKQQELPYIPQRTQQIQIGGLK